MEQHNCLVNNKHPVLLWDNANILLKKCSPKSATPHAEFLLLFLNWQYTFYINLSLINTKKAIFVQWLATGYPHHLVCGSKSRYAQKEVFLMNDQHNEIITLHVYWRSAFSPNKNTLPWSKLPWTDLITSHRLETWV